ncbi:MAG: hypothetical protein ACXVGA_00940 [Mycobacteriaceae bacterium]
MTDPTTPDREQESVAVTLARIDEKLNNFLFRMTDLTVRVDKHETRISDAEKAIISTQSVAMSWKAWLPLVVSVASLLILLYGVLK